MATRTISNAGGNWNATTSWVEGAVPTAADDVVATATSGNLTTVTTCNCRSLNFTNYTGTLTHGAGTTINIGDASGGALTFVAGMGYTGGGNLALVATSNNGGAGWPLTFAGKTVHNVFVGAISGGSGGHWVLQDVLNALHTSASTLSFYAGTFDTNGNTINSRCIATALTTAKTLYFRTSAINLSSNCTVAMSTGSNITLDAGTSVITVTPGLASLSPVWGNLTYNEIKYSGTTLTTLTLSGSPTITNLNLTNCTSLRTVKFTSGTTTTIPGVFTCSGTTSYQVALQSVTAGSAFTLSKAIGDVACDYLDIKDSTVSGGAGWYAGSHSINVGNNTGWLWQDLITDVPGTFSATDAPDTASLSGSLYTSGTLSGTDTADNTSISGTLAVSGILSATETPDTASMAGVLIAIVDGVLYAVEVPDGATISGIVSVTGTLSATDKADLAKLESIASFVIYDPRRYTILDVCNIALARIGISQFLGKAGGQTDDYFYCPILESRICSMFFEFVLERVLEEFPWNFATKFMPLARYTAWDENWPAGWTYAYEYPLDCVFARRIWSGQYPDVNATREPFRLADNGIGSAPVILTNKADAVLEYTFVASDLINIPDCRNAAGSGYGGSWGWTPGGSSAPAPLDPDPQPAGRYMFLTAHDYVCLSLPGFGNVWLIHSTFISKIELDNFSIIDTKKIDGSTYSSVGLIPDSDSIYNNFFMQIGYAGDGVLIVTPAGGASVGVPLRDLVIDDQLSVARSDAVAVNSIGYRWLFSQTPAASGKMYQISLYYQADGVHIAAYSGFSLVGSHKIVTPVAGYTAGFCSNVGPDDCIYILYDDALSVHHVLKYNLAAGLFVMDGTAPKEYWSGPDDWDTGNGYFNYELLAVDSDGVLNIVMTDANSGNEWAERIDANGTALANLPLIAGSNILLWYDIESNTVCYLMGAGQTKLAVINLGSGAVLMEHEFGYTNDGGSLSSRVSTVTSFMIDGDYLLIPMLHTNTTNDGVVCYLTKIELATGTIVSKIGPLSEFGMMSYITMVAVPGADLTDTTTPTIFTQPGIEAEVLPIPYESMAIPRRYILA